MEAPSQWRKIRCGLPPLLPFPPDPTYSTSEPPDSDERTSCGQHLWETQLKEQEFMKTANRRIRWLLIRLSAHIDSSECCALDPNDLFPTNHCGGVENDACLLTIFDVNRIANTLKSCSCELDIVLESSETSSSTVEEVEDTTCFRYWSERISQRRHSISAPLCWSDILALPLEDAASNILELYEIKNDGIKGSVEGARNYLLYQASQTLRNIEEFALPSLKQRLKQQQIQRHKMQATQKEFENRYNKTFEHWDDYCMNVLKVESDILPLCPLLNDISPEDETTIDSYAKDIGKCVFEPLRKELHTLSDRFVKLLSGAATEGFDQRRYYGQSISHAIKYYRRFIEFTLSHSHDISNHQQSIHRNNEVPLETLYQFATQSDSNDNHQGGTCISQFINSPAVRANLVSNLQQLNAFLSCRKGEVSRISSRGFGHTVAEAIDMEWAQFCIKRGADQATEEGVSKGLDKISSDDIIRFQEATHFLLTQIVGDGAQAKRLRLLADAVGYPCNNEVTSIESFSLHFDLLCQKAANLSRQMTFFDEQSKGTTKIIKRLELEIDVTLKEVRVMENRMSYISDGLKAS